eukprot:365506-Chlamydomonas_euryale.AAC.14
MSCITAHAVSQRKLYQSYAVPQHTLYHSKQDMRYTAPSYIIPSTTCGMHHDAMLHVTHNVQHATCNMQHATCPFLPPRLFAQRRRTAIEQLPHVARTQQQQHEGAPAVAAARGVVAGGTARLVRPRGQTIARHARQPMRALPTNRRLSLRARAARIRRRSRRIGKSVRRGGGVRLCCGDAALGEAGSQARNQVAHARLAKQRA